MRQNSRIVPNLWARYIISNRGYLCKYIIGLAETIVTCNQTSLFAVDMGSNQEICFFLVGLAFLEIHC